MELNYGNILDIIIESESLESPDWIWKARVGGDFYPGHWVCGCKLAGISGDYYNPDDIGNPLKVVALPPEEEPFYEYGGNPGEEDRRRFYVLKEPCCREPVGGGELFVCPGVQEDCFEYCPFLRKDGEGNQRNGADSGVPDQAF
ncbi:MAG: hypothetical protein ACLT8C_00100 [Akkermansia muciniphila]